MKSTDWPEVRLGDIASAIEYGVTASANQAHKGPKFLRITDIQNGGVDWDSVPWCDVDPMKAKRSRLVSGDIVFARTGATTGKSYLIENCPRDAVFASYLIRVRMSRSAEPRYVSHYFATPGYWDQIRSNARGAAQPGINASVLRKLLIPLPPIEEQRRIAAILDKADEVRAKRRASLETLGTVSQAVFAKWFGDPLSGDDRYPLTTLDKAVTFHGGGTPPRSVPSYYEGDICWATSKDMQHPFLDDTQEHITTDAITDSATKLVPTGAVLVVVKSKVLAHRLPVAVARVPTCFGQDLNLDPPTDDLAGQRIRWSAS